MSPRNEPQSPPNNLILWGKNINRGNGSKSVVGNSQNQFKSRRASRGGNEAKQNISGNQQYSANKILES